MTPSAAAAATETSLYERLGWFQVGSSDTSDNYNDARWWPAVYYPSHQVALQHVNLDVITDPVQKCALTLQFLNELKTGAAAAQPVAQLIRSSNDNSDGVELRPVTDRSTQWNGDFLGFSLQLSPELVSNNAELNAALATVEKMLREDKNSNEESSSSSSSSESNNNNNHKTSSTTATKAAAPSSSNNSSTGKNTGDAASTTKTTASEKAATSPAVENGPSSASSQQASSLLKSPPPSQVVVDARNTTTAPKEASAAPTTQKEPTSKNNHNPESSPPDLSQEQQEEAPPAGSNSNNAESATTTTTTTTMEQDTSDADKAVDIQANDSWEAVWIKLRQVGWYKRARMENPLQQIFVQPNCGISNTYQAGIHYFESEQDVQEYIATQYPHWLPPSRRNNRVSVSAVKQKKNNKNNKKASNNGNNTTVVAKTPANRRTTKPQDPANPLPPLSSASSCSSLDSEECQDFGTLWAHLKCQGWRHIVAKNKLHNWWYIRPGRSVTGGTPGVDYFVSEQDVIDFIQTQRDGAGANNEKTGDDDDDEEVDPVQHVAVQGAQSVATRRKRKSGQNSSLPRKKLLSSSSKKTASVTNKKADTSKKAITTNSTARKRVNSSSAKKKGNNNKRRKKGNGEHWWKHEAVPADEDMWLILKEKFGYYETKDGGFCFPKHVDSLDKLDFVPVFVSLTGLRKFLCAYGVPNYKDKALSKKEHEQLQRWIAFANVPVTHENSVRKLSDLTSFRNDSDLLKWLYHFGWSTVNGKLFVPGYTQIGEDARLNPKHGVHFFHMNELRTAVKCYVRNAWRFGVLCESKEEEEPCSPDRFSTTPTKDLSEKEQVAHLRLRLWAAVTSQDPTDFKGEFPDNEYVRPLTKIPSMEEASSDDESDVSSILSAASPSSDVTMESSPEASVLSSPESPAGVELTTPKTASAAPTGKKRRQTAVLKSVAKKPSNFPDFLRDIWSISQKLGFQYKGKYVHRQISQGWDKAEAMQKFLCSYGIPNFESLDAEQKKLMHLWISFAHTGVPESSIPDELAKELPSDNEIRAMLLKLGFSFFGGKIFPPGADSLKGSLTKRRHKIHYLIGLDEIRDYIRGSESLRLLNEDERRIAGRRRQKNDELREIERTVRVWAARSGRPFPKFQPQAAVAPQQADQPHSNDEATAADSAEGEETKTSTDEGTLARNNNSVQVTSTIELQEEGKTAQNEAFVESADQNNKSESERESVTETPKHGPVIVRGPVERNGDVEEDSNGSGEMQSSTTANPNVLEDLVQPQQDEQTEQDPSDQSRRSVSDKEIEPSDSRHEDRENMVQQENNLAQNDGSSKVPAHLEITGKVISPTQHDDDATESNATVPMEQDTCSAKLDQSLASSLGTIAPLAVKESVATRPTGDSRNDSEIEVAARSVNDESQKLEVSEGATFRQGTTSPAVESSIESVDTSHSIPRPNNRRPSSPDGSVVSQGPLNLSVLETLSNECEVSDESIADPNILLAVTNTEPGPRNQRRSLGQDTLATLDYHATAEDTTASQQLLTQADIPEKEDSSDDEGSITSEKYGNEIDAPLMTQEDIDDDYKEEEEDGYM